jgi:hypothetical protein
VAKASILRLRMLLWVEHCTWPFSLLILHVLLLTHQVVCGIAQHVHHEKPHSLPIQYVIDELEKY